MISIKDLLARLVLYIRSLFAKTKTVIATQTEARERIAKLLAYYDGDQLRYLTDLIPKRFPRSAEEVRKYADTDNIVKTITDSVAQTFKAGIAVEAVNESDKDVYAEVVDKNRFDVFIQNVENRLFLCHTVFVKAYWDLVDHVVRFELLTPEWVNVDPDDRDPQKIGTIVYPTFVKRAENTTTLSGEFNYWTSSEYRRVTESGRPIENPQNESGVNPYGRVPFVTIRIGNPVSSDFWKFPYETGLELQQDNLNLALTHLNWVKVMQTFGIPILKGRDYLRSGDPRNDNSAHPTEVVVTYSMNQAIEFGRAPKDEQVGLEFVKPANDLTLLQEGVDKQRQRIFESYGISPSSLVSTAQVKSAAALTLESAKLEEYRDKSKQTFAFAVQELFELVRVIHNVHAEEAQLKKLSDAGVKVTFMDNRVAEKSVDDQIKETDYKLEKNILNLVDVMIAEHDDLDAREAEERIVKNAEVNKRISERIASLAKTKSAFGFRFAKPDGENRIVKDDSESGATDQLQPESVGQV